ncbi:hypothetical protein K7G98_16975 [Saccharothrix sp. MB29]|nr:hypothetical protein [Saccharothrix sp. MB29]
MLPLLTVTEQTATAPCSVRQRSNHSRRSCSFLMRLSRWVMHASWLDHYDERTNSPIN